VILNMTPPMIDKNMWSTMGHTRYYRMFIKIYASIIVTLEKLLKKYEVFNWKPKCDQALDVIKQTLCTSPTMIYID
jgi:hypothetical protein